MSRNVYVPILIAAVIGISFLPVAVVYGQIMPEPTGGSGDVKVHEINQILELAAKIYGYLVSLIGILAVGAIVWAGFLYMTSSGTVKTNEQQMSQAKRVVTWALIGLFVGMLSFVIVRFFGSEVFKSDGGGGTSGGSSSEGDLNPWPNGNYSPSNGSTGGGSQPTDSGERWRPPEPTNPNVAPPYEIPMDF